MVLYAMSCFIQGVALRGICDFFPPYPIRVHEKCEAQPNERTKKNSFTAISLHEIIKSSKVPRLQHYFYGFCFIQVYRITHTRANAMLRAFFSYHRYNFSLSFWGKEVDITDHNRGDRKNNTAHQHKSNCTRGKRSEHERTNANTNKN